ncbi:sensor histidine kinase [Nocardioidaceae bacterium]|nr:sensor histidine kinase [Nocardioidaceae bacterium]
MSQPTTPGPGTAGRPPVADQDSDPGPDPVELTGAGRTTHDGPSYAHLVRSVAVRAALVLVVVILAGVLAARALAEREALADATTTADVLATSAVRSALTEGVVTGDPAALLEFDRLLRPVIEDSTLVRANIWDDDGLILWSDEPRLVGERRVLGEARSGVLASGATQASVVDFSSLQYSDGLAQQELLQVFRPVSSPEGTAVLFEIYATYESVDTRADDLTRGFSAITISALLVFVVLLLPLLRRLTSGLQQAQAARERLLEGALDASAEERRRIAGDLHDGVVQELAATSFALSGAAARAPASDPDLRRDLEDAGSTLRSSIAGLRSLLVDIYPRSLEQSGLAAALDDLAGTLRSRGISVDVAIDDEVVLDAEQERLVFRVVRECLHNVRRHARADRVTIALAAVEDGAELRVADDGLGFDLTEVQERPEHGHVGLRVMADVAARHGARLSVSTAPGDGCTWIMEVPT